MKYENLSKKSKASLQIPLKQASYHISQDKINTILEGDVVFGLPQTVFDLVEIGKAHEHALVISHFTEACRQGKTLIFTLKPVDGDYFTFEFEIEKPTSDGFSLIKRHAVGFRNAPVPSGCVLEQMAKKIAEIIVSENANQILTGEV